MAWTTPSPPWGGGGGGGYPSAKIKLQGMKFFLIHPGNWNIFLEGFKSFCVVLKKEIRT